MRALVTSGALDVIPRVAPVLPDRMLRRIAEEATAGIGVALCLHRVSSHRRPTDPIPPLTIAPDRLDRVIELLGGGAAEPRQFKLTLSFDDGYLDALEYVGSRAPRHPSVEWMFFVCPEKVERKSAFRWDEYEQLGAGRPPGGVEAFLDRNLRRAGENDRDSLRALGNSTAFGIASVEQCRELGRLENVTLGNHTNTHFRLTRLTVEDARDELETSTRDFERLLGPCQHFAFPYGHPRRDIAPEHLDVLRSLGSPVAWSTWHRPYSPDDRKPGALLPRFPVNGTWSAESIVLWVAALALRFRLSRSPAPVPGVAGTR